MLKRFSFVGSLSYVVKSISALVANILLKGHGWFDAELYGDSTQAQFVP